MNQQTQAQRLADRLDLYATGDDHQQDTEKAAAELRRLDEENESLREQNTAVDAACAKLEAANAELLAACKLFVAYDNNDATDGVAMMVAYSNAVTAARAAIAKHGGAA